jgi:hypothetical protein
MQKMARQGKDARDARHRHAIIGMPSAIAIGIGIIGKALASARHAIIGIGRSRHRQGIGIILGMPSASAGHCSRTQQSGAV